MNKQLITQRILEIKWSDNVNTYVIPTVYYNIPS